MDIQKKLNNMGWDCFKNLRDAGITVYKKDEPIKSFVIDGNWLLKLITKKMAWDYIKREIKILSD